MGNLALAAKITHVPTMVLSERDGPFKDCRKPAIDSLKALGEKAREIGVDTYVARCFPSTRRSAMGKASWPIPRCCSVRWAGATITAGRQCYAPISKRPGLARSMRNSPSATD